MEAQRKALIQYLSGSSARSRGGVIVLVVCLLTAVFFPPTAALLVVAMIYAFCVSLLPAFARSKLKKRLDALSEAEITQVLRDFSAAQPVLNDAMRLGSHYAFGRKTCLYHPYREMARVYQYVHRTNFIVDRRTLNVCDRGGKVCTLCLLPRKGANESELNQTVFLLMQKQPQLQIGYQKK